jgi:1-acyl-sn-glycerol-3-phosphate acyltransferase
MEYLKYLVLIPFSLVYVVVSYALMGLGGILFAVLKMFGVSHSLAHKWCAARPMALCLRLTFSRIRVIYSPDFDPNRRSVFVQNHVSMLDGHAGAVALPHEFCGVMNAWHFNVPCYGWIMRTTLGIPLYPHKDGRTAEVTAAARNRVDRGLSILVFPEGHRTRDGKVKEFKRGMFFMARDAEIPMVPFAVRGLGEVNGKGSYLFKPGTITMYVGAQVETKGLSDEEVRELALTMRDEIVHFVDTGEVFGSEHKPKAEALAA